MATYRYLANDILKEFKQLNVTSTLKLAQVFFWINTIANRYRGKHIEKGYLTGAYLNIFPNIPVLIANVNTTRNVVRARKYFVLPTNIYDYKNEKAIDYITYENFNVEGFRRVKFQPTSPDKAEILEYSDYERPTPANPYFYRVHEYVYLLGVENVSIPRVEIGLYSALLTKTNLVNLDDEIDLDEQSISQLRMELLTLGKFMLVTPQADRQNDGDEDVNTVPLERSKTPQAPPEQQE